MIDFLTYGWHSGADIALAVERGVVGVFFAISGWHKLTNPPRHARFVETLKADRVPFIAFNQWWVPSVELVAGALLALGALSVISAILLLVVCLVACILDGAPRIKEFAPIDRADWLDDLFYLPEILYSVMLLTTILAGPGAYSVDYYLWR